MKLNVVKLRVVWYVASAAMVILSLMALGAWGLKQGIEFTGGTLMALRFESRPTVAAIQESLVKAVPDLGTAVVQHAGDTDAQVRLRPISEEQHQSILSELRNVHGTTTEMRYDAIGPVIGDELRSKSIQGLIVVLLAIMAYVAYAFRKVSAPIQSWKYGFVTILAAFHDVIVPMGVFAFLGHYYGVEIGTPFIAAVLTILGYSITDTIVVMDRVRENLQKMSGSFADIVQTSVSQTFVRSFNTSMTTLLALIAIYFFGGETLHEFTLTLIIGIAVGTYSSIFIASPLLVTWDKLSRRFGKR